MFYSLIHCHEFEVFFVDAVLLMDIQRLCHCGKHSFLCEELLFAYLSRASWLRSVGSSWVPAFVFFTEFSIFVSITTVLISIALK